ncbi:MAG: hypothetical protein QM478_07610 [Flavobacteriaceae bacterium]
MKQVFHKIASFLMAFVVLFSTLSFTVDMHYCGDTLVDTAFFTDADSCGMEMDSVINDECSIVKKECCTDVHLTKNSQDAVKYSFDDLTFNQQIVAVSFIYSYINLFEGLEENIIPFQDYSPPLVVDDIQLLDESFLI